MWKARPQQTAKTPKDASPETGEARSKKRHITRRRFLKVCGALTLIGGGAPLEAHYVEPAMIDVTRHEVFLPHLPVALDGVRVAHLTDLHRSPVTPDSTIQEAIRRAAEAAPDLIALTGDFVGRDPADAEALAPMLSPLREAQPRFGMFGCLGNHDYSDHTGDAVTHALTEGTGLVMLRNERRELAPGLVLAGVEDKVRGVPDMKRALDGVPERDTACVVLAHNPRAVFDCDKQPVVVLSGHTHGGQIVLPFLAPRLPHDVQGFPLAAGWGRFDRAQLYISRGVGMTGLPMRFRCRPEVALITLRRGDGSPITHTDLAERAFRKAKRIARAAYQRLS